MRNRSVGGWSIERLIRDLSGNLSNNFHVKFRYNSFRSKGIFKRFSDVLLAPLYQGDINHISGDVHYLCYLLNRRKTILTIHDCVMMERLSGIKRFIFWLFWLWIPYKRSGIIVAISEATKSQLIKYLKCDPTTIKVIYDNVSPEFKPQPKKFNSNNPRILHIGTGENKNLLRHIEAVSDILCHFVIVGNISDYIKNKLYEKKIDFTNISQLTNEEILEQYRLCDILLFCSTYEGFGLPIIEAQSVGRAVITSNKWSMPEVAGEGACIVDPTNILEINFNLKNIINNEKYRKILIKNGLENVKRFSLEECSRQYSELYYSLLEIKSS